MAAKAKTNGGVGRSGGARSGARSQVKPARAAAAPAAKGRPRTAAPKRAAKAPARTTAAAAAGRSAAKAAAKPPQKLEPKSARKPEPKAPLKTPAARTARKLSPAKAARPRKPAPRAKGIPGLTEEEQIEAAKYLPRDVPPKRLFEEERFVFPETYGITRVRLLVKDPEWLFAHWDVDPKTLASLRAEVGERAMALSRMTLRIADPDQGGQKTILLPAGAKSWYVRADARRARAYRAELGLTLPSGDFRSLASSNTVATPRVGPSAEEAAQRRRVGRPSDPSPSAGSPNAAGAGRGKSAGKAAAKGNQPWRPSPARLDGEQAIGAGSTAAGERGTLEPDARGGASDTFRPGGASDVHRR